MTCASAQALLHPYLDDELDPAEKSKLAEHLETCPACAAMHARLVQLRSDVRAKAPYFPAPPELRGQITTAIRDARRQERHPWRYLAIAAGLLLALSAAWNVTLLRSGGSSSSELAQNILSDHVRSLMGTHLLDVPSSDQHTVKPWFNGKLDFSPEVRDFPTEGFPLIGGRLDYAADRTVAALVYQRRKHVINLFVWPSTALTGAGEFSRNGYNMVHWANAGMTWWAVSDLNAGELRQFEQLYRSPRNSMP